MYMMGFQCLFYPIDTVRRRIMMQSGRIDSQKDYHGVLDCVRKMKQREGYKGFFRGVWVNQIRTLCPTLMIIVSDTCKNYFERIK